MAAWAQSQTAKAAYCLPGHRARLPRPSTACLGTEPGHTRLPGHRARLPGLPGYTRLPRHRARLPGLPGYTARLPGLPGHRARLPRPSTACLGTEPGYTRLPGHRAGLPGYTRLPGHRARLPGLPGYRARLPWLPGHRARLPRLHAYCLPGPPGFIRLPGTSDCQGSLETQKVLCAPRQSTVDSKENFAPPS